MEFYCQFKSLFDRIFVFYEFRLGLSFTCCLKISQRLWFFNAKNTTTMKPIIKRVFDIIRIAEECSDEQSYFNLFKDVLSNVSNVSHLVYSEPGELNLLQEVANRGLAKYVKYLFDTFPGMDPNASNIENPPAIFLAIKTPIITFYKFSSIIDSNNMVSITANQLLLILLTHMLEEIFFIPYHSTKVI